STHNSQPPCCFRLRSKLIIAPPTCDVGGDGHRAWLSCLCHDIRLLSMLLGIQDLVLDLSEGKHPTQQLRDLDRSGTHQDRTSRIGQFIDLIYHSVKLLPNSFVHFILSVIPLDTFVSRNDDHIQLIVLPEFSCFRLGSTGHTRQLVVHSEVVLQGDGSVSLGSILYLHILFRLNSLMKPIRITPALHYPAGLLVYNLYFLINQ